MDAIHRIPPAHEQAMWPDTLPTNIVVPAMFTWHVPSDLDLSDTDLTALGTVQLPPVPSVSVAASTETVAGVVELATQAEVDAGTDALRAVTPATLAGWTGGGGGGVFDSVSVTEIGFTGISVTLDVRLLAGSTPPTQRCALIGGVTFDPSGFPDGLSSFEAITGVLLSPSEAFYVLAATEADGSIVLKITSAGLTADTPALLWIATPSGTVSSHSILLRGSSPT